MLEVKEIIDLAHPLYNGMANLGADIVAFWRTENFETTRLQSGGRLAFESRMMLLSEHCGTHVDAPYHWNENGWKVDEIPLESLVLPGYLCDFTAKKTGEPITIADFERVEAERGSPIGPGCAVVAWTGVSDRWGEEGFATDRPFVPTETAEWLVGRKISLFASDLIGIDDPSEWWWPTHVAFLGANVPMVQQLSNLHRLSGKEFLFVATPLAMRGGTGSPVRPIAIVG